MKMKQSGSLLRQSSVREEQCWVAIMRPSSSNIVNTSVFVVVEETFRS